MVNNNLLQQLSEIIHFKKNLQFYAQRLGVTVDEIIEAKKELSRQRRAEKTSEEMAEEIEKDNYISELEGKIIENYNLDNGTGTLTGVISDRPLSPEEIEVKYQINKAKWRLSGYWNKQQPNGKYLVSANVSQLKGELDPTYFQEKFQEFLTGYKPQYNFKHLKQLADNREKVSLILPTQDAHYNKYDIYGDNNISKRFETILDKTNNIIKKAQATSYLEEIVYVIGSDMFNSEYTNATTKGTQQTNILTYEGGFVAICQHQVDIITLLLNSADKVKIVYVPGNHDHFVGWHLITWLEAYFKNVAEIRFDSSTLCRKYYKFGNSGIMLNHGDAMKPQDLAATFPIEFKKDWSFCDHYLIITGDKHHMKHLDINGIQFYQIPQLSNAKSNWDDKQGYTKSKAEMTAFVITQTNGLTDIYKEII
jgi:UDP-2,3-diacylglucosamine pyrophosphatase LpxH